MSDEQQVDYESQAKKIGWIPLEQFKGDEKKWVDAETFVKRGEEFLPFIKAENRHLKTEVEQLRGKYGEVETLLKETQKTVEALREYNSEVNKDRVEGKRKAIVEGIKEARAADDVEREEALRTELRSTEDALKEAEKKPEEKPKADSTPSPVQPTPEFDNWKKDNPWFEQDEVMRQAAVLISTQMAKTGELNSLSLAERYNVVGEAVKKKFKVDAPPNRTSKVEAARGGGANSMTSGRGYADLPADARAACDRFADRFVGKGRAYPDVKAWREKYVKDYFTE